MAPQRRRARSAADEEEEEDTKERRRPAVRRELDAGEAPADTSDTGGDTGPGPGQDGHRPDGPGERRVRTAGEAARAALGQILELTDKQPESITGVQRTRDGWSVCFEMLEDHRIPSSADILATYESTVDSDGELMSFRRVRRYSRGRGDGS